MLCRDDLHDYQRRAVDFILTRKRCQLWLDMGMGKSATTLTAVADLSDSFTIAKALIIAPLRVANSVWAQEKNKWTHTKHLSVNVVTGSEKARISALNSTADVYVINRENVVWLVKYYGDKWPFDCVIIDEASSFKSNASRRFKALKKAIHKSDYAVLLTGTPSPNGLLDLWAQVFLVDAGASLCRTFTDYKQRFFEPSYMGYKFTPRHGASEKIHDLLRPFTMSMTASDYLTLPDRIDAVELVTLKPATLDAYREFEKHCIAELGGEEIEALNAAALANKLLQWCNGAVYVDEHKNYAQVHDEKINALSDIIDDNPNENILVAYNYKSDLERLQKRFKDAVVLDKNPDTVTKWNNGEIKILLAHPASAGHGLNLQKGGSVIVWFGLNWSLELYQQFNARLHRQGQEKPVRVIHLVADGCLDARVMSVIGDKAATQNGLINALKMLTPCKS